jgi:hypothetical protein
MTDLRYPIGPFKHEGDVTNKERMEWIKELADAPQKIREAVVRLSPKKLDIPYRPGGWTARQVVHHLADSHLNSYVRYKLALTEENPTIKPYDEGQWAELEDARTGPIEVSLSLIESLHHRWVLLLRSLSPEDFSRTFIHPDRGVVRLDKTLGLYAWHGNHHIAHINIVGNSMS